MHILTLDDDVSIVFVCVQGHVDSCWPLVVPTMESRLKCGPSAVHCAELWLLLSQVIGDSATGQLMDFRCHSLARHAMDCLPEPPQTSLNYVNMTYDDI